MSIQIEHKAGPDGHPCRTFHNIIIRPNSLNVFLASRRRNNQSSSMWCISHMACALSIAPSIPPSYPPQQLSVLQVIVTSLPVTNKTDFEMARHHVSPISMGLTPGILSNANTFFRAYCSTSRPWWYCVSHPTGEVCQ
jgi:hypothetical protein